MAVSFTLTTIGDRDFRHTREETRTRDRRLDGVFALAMRVGAFAHAIAWLRQRDHLSAMERTEFDRGFPIVLRCAILQTL
jgi:hypothetical protein